MNSRSFVVLICVSLSYLTFAQKVGIQFYQGVNKPLVSFSGDNNAYVFHYTDFSAGRAEMLKKEIKVSDSKKQIEEIFAAEVLENVKKGWEKV